MDFFVSSPDFISQVCSLLYSITCHVNNSDVTRGVTFALLFLFPCDSLFSSSVCGSIFAISHCRSPFHAFGTDFHCGDILLHLTAVLVAQGFKNTICIWNTATFLV